MKKIKRLKFFSDFRIFGIVSLEFYPDPRDFGILSGFSNPDPDSRDFGILGFFDLAQNKKSNPEANSDQDVIFKF